LRLPDANFLAAVGMAAVVEGDAVATQKAVDLAARVELTKRLSVSVSSVFKSYQAERQKDDKVISEQNIEDQSREVVDNVKLEGVEIAKRWLDKDNKVAYAVAVWNKTRAQAILKARINESESAKRTALAEGDKAAATSPIGASRVMMMSPGEGTARLRLRNCPTPRRRGSCHPP
jgi:hypothetical protein